jgi:putative FmdB family regulatory protein
MPIYEYRCDSCGTRHEVLQKLSDAPLTDCPSCAQPSLHKLISAAGFQLKGSGWYATDFRNGSKGGKGDGKDSAKDEPKTGDETKPKEEIKPKEEAKTDAVCGAVACPACQ